MTVITVQGASAGLHVNVTVDGAQTDQLGSLLTSFSDALSANIDSYDGRLLSSGATSYADSNLLGLGVVTAAGSYQISGNVGALVFGGVYSDATVAPSSHLQIDLTGVTSSSITVAGGTTGGVQVQAGTTGGVFIAGSGNNSFVGSMASVSTGVGNWSILAGSGNDTIMAGAGQNTINAGTGSNVIDISHGTNTVSSYGTDTISGGGNNQTVSVYGGSSFISVGQQSFVSDQSSGSNAVTVGGNSTVYGGSSDQVSLNGGVSSVVGGTADTISASQDAYVVFATDANVSVDGSLTFIGGTGQTTVTSAQSTIFGSSDLYVSLNGTGSGQNLFVANNGNETLDGSNSLKGIQAFGNVQGYTGTQVFLGGTASDTLVAGVGDATMTGGSGADNIFAFRNGLAGASYEITDFGSVAGNLVGLLNYTSTDLQNALTNQVNSNGSTTITLSDNSKITFDNVASLNSSDFQIW